jgi:hypothetical protein
MRLLIFLLVLTFIISTFGRKPFRPWAKGKACSSKVIKFCKKKCPSGKTCENLNKRNPNNKTKKRSYCKKEKVRCVKPAEECHCPMNINPVCDANGNYYDNVECAVCKGLTSDEVSPCELGVIGTAGPLF